MSFYAPENKTGNLLAQQVKGYRIQMHIPYLTHPVTKETLLNPKATADAFSSYYSSLYNLRVHWKYLLLTAHKFGFQGHIF